ncbi:MAG: hypothetical protein R3C14_33560 [Caldilineaceae bacterium]
MRLLTYTVTFICLLVVVGACSGVPAALCPRTAPVWAKPPDDAAVEGSPGFGHYFINADRSIWAAAWWTGQEQSYLRAGREGVKVGWFRPAGATLTITGRRLDAEAPPLTAHIPCCYPTHFQASGLIFPTAGCWAVAAKAADRTLAFIVWVEP